MAKEFDKRQMALMAAMYDEAITNALLHGFGLIKITHVRGALEFEAISPYEYRDLSDDLKWASNNIQEVPLQ
jgi:hypothetical protein